MRESLATPYLKNENAFFDISLGFFLIVIGDSSYQRHLVLIVCKVLRHTRAGGYSNELRF
jgi:hypothetical protein